MVSLVGHHVYLDANTIIYAIEGYSQYANLQTGLLVPLDAGDFTAATSEITLVETLVGPRKAGDETTEADYRAFLTPSGSMSILPITSPVLEKVIELRVQYGFKIPDAIHLATGILAGCTVFVTRDMAWLKAGVTVINPTDLTLR